MPRTGSSRRRISSSTSTPGSAWLTSSRSKFSVFARVDRYDDPCPDCSGIDYLPIDTSAPFTLFLAGVEYYLLPSVRFSPNVEWVTYSSPEQAGAARPKDDLVWRATFYWAW